MAKRVALALGSGGARGYAYIGVVDELRSRGYEIVGVAGSSMGALVGGLLAAGSLDEFAAWATTLTQRAMLRLLDPSISAAGVLRAGKILDAVRDILGEVTIESLPVPYTAVATDLIAGKSVWLQHGPVDEAIRASIAIPGVILGTQYDGHTYVDGCVTNPVPFNHVQDGMDIVVAVDVSGRPREANGHRSNMELAVGSLLILFNQVASLRREISPPDIYVRPAIDSFSGGDFFRIREVLEQAQPAKDQLKRELERRLG